MTMSDWSKVTRPIPVPNELTKPFREVTTLRWGYEQGVGSGLDYLAGVVAEMRTNELKAAARRRSRSTAMRSGPR